MNFYTNTHPYYCGIDLHTRLLYVCIIDNENNILVHEKIDDYKTSTVLTGPASIILTGCR